MSDDEGSCYGGESDTEPEIYIPVERPGVPETPRKRRSRPCTPKLKVLETYIRGAFQGGHTCADPAMTHARFRAAKALGFPELHGFDPAARRAWDMAIGSLCTYTEASGHGEGMKGLKYVFTLKQDAEAAPAACATVGKRRRVDTPPSI